MLERLYEFEIIYYEYLHDRIINEIIDNLSQFLKNTS